MYTWGHIEILKAAIKESNIQFTTEELQQIYKGLRYPDFPCGSYHFDNQGRRMIFKDNICTLFSVFKDLNILPNYFASAYASHNGYYSVWHSMTYNPERPVYKINRDIMDQIISFLSLCFVDENTGEVRPTPQCFWLGMALHVVMDSYSPAHTLRCNPETNCQSSIDQVKQYPATLTPAMQKANAVLKELKDRLMSISSKIDDDDKEQVSQILHDIFKKHKIRGLQKKHDLQKTAMFLYFHNHHQIRIKQEITEKNVEKKVPKDTAHVISMIRPIVTFFSYPQQSGWYHKLNDTIYMLKKNNLYDSAVSDCVQLIKMTIPLLQEKTITKNKVKKYLLQVYAFLFHHTFKLAPGVAQMNTGVSNQFYKRRL